jgi:hypothetical protein
MPALVRAGSICLLAGVVCNAIQASLIASAAVTLAASGPESAKRV